MGRPSRVVALTLLVSFACSGCTWSMFGFGPANTRVNPIVAGLSASNVGTIVLKGTAVTGGMIDSSPAVVTTGSNGHVTGTVYVGSDDGKLYAFDEFGSANCSGTPKSCTPLWTATTGGEITSSPAVVNGVVYVGSDDDKLYAFDATGTTNCSGTPKTCAPLWTGATGGLLLGPPTVANGVAYVRSDEGTLNAFDANGTTNCSGIPKTCAPLWTARGFAPDGDSGGVLALTNVSEAPAVANGDVYLAGGGSLDAFDASGTTNCSGTPKICAPLWSGAVGKFDDTSPTVANGTVYVSSYDEITMASGFGEPTNGTLWAFDASGTTNCSGTPKTCTPLWQGGNGNGVESSPAVGNGIVYTASLDGTVAAWNGTATARCTGTPKTCPPLWIATIGGVFFFSSPAIENGILFIGSDDQHLYAFDANGSKNCSGTAPKKCTPLWSAATNGAVRSSPAPVGNNVYVGSEDHKLYAYGLP